MDHSIIIINCLLQYFSVFQTVIGNVEVKTKSIHFYVQRNYNFDKNGAIIPFQVARLNIGEAMNLNTGVFTAPVSGIYHFELSGVKDLSGTYLYIDLQVNGVKVGSAHNQIASGGTHLRVSLTASLRLKVNDKVNLFLTGGIFFDNTGYHNHFTGWLMEEDLI